MLYWRAGGSEPRSADQIRKVARVQVREVQRSDAGYRVVVEVENVGSGHMIPTGIPTQRRELVVRLRHG